MRILQKNPAILIAAAAVISSVASAEVNVGDGRYVLVQNGVQLGNDVAFDLANGGDTIELPRGEFSILNNDEGYLVNGCLSLYRGAQISVRQMCGENEAGDAIYCRVLPPDIMVASIEELATTKNVVGVYLKPEGKGKLRIRVEDPQMLSGGLVNKFNAVNEYQLSQDGKSRCPQAE